MGEAQPPPPDRPDRPPLDAGALARVRFVLELVDLLAERDGFDPAAFVDPRTGEPLGGAMKRMRTALGGEATQSPPAGVDPSAEGG
jgi:hypothetical protein